MKKIRFALCLALLASGFFSLAWAIIVGNYPGFDNLLRRADVIVVARIPPPPLNPPIYDPTNGTLSSGFAGCDISIVKVIKGDSDRYQGKDLTIRLGIFAKVVGNPSPQANKRLDGDATATLNQTILEGIARSIHDPFGSSPMPGELYLFFLKEYAKPIGQEPGRLVSPNVAGSALLLDSPESRAGLSSATLELQRQALAPLPKTTPSEDEKTIKNEVLRVIIVFLTTDRPDRARLIRQLIEP